MHREGHRQRETRFASNSESENEATTEKEERTQKSGVRTEETHTSAQDGSELERGGRDGRCVKG
jgi:hypothetical protein